MAIDALFTDRLLLREFVDTDFDALREIDGDPEILRYRTRTEITPAQTRAFLVQAQSEAADQPRQRYALAVVLRDGGRLVGQCGLTIVNLAYDEAFMWYSVSRREWGQGYATEAAGRLLRFGFEDAGLRRIFAECHPENLASARVLEKIGLRRESVSGAERLRYAATKDEHRAQTAAGGR
jgi:ribosomal-protein-alanine N-acetyltransferase